MSDDYKNGHLREQGIKSAEDWASDARLDQAPCHDCKGHHRWRNCPGHYAHTQRCITNTSEAVAKALAEKYAAKSKASSSVHVLRRVVNQADFGEAADALQDQLMYLPCSDLATYLDPRAMALLHLDAVDDTNVFLDTAAEYFSETGATGRSA